MKFEFDEVAIEKLKEKVELVGDNEPVVVVVDNSFYGGSLAVDISIKSEAERDVEMVQLESSEHNLEYALYYDDTLTKNQWPEQIKIGWSKARNTWYQLI